MQRKCHFLVYLVGNSIYFYPETLIIIVFKPYLQKIDKHTKDILKIFKDLNQLFDRTKNAVSCDYLASNENRKRARNFSSIPKNVFLSAQIGQSKAYFSSADTKFDIICVSENWVSKKNSLATDIDVSGYIVLNTPQLNHQIISRWISHIYIDKNLT